MWRNPNSAFRFARHLAVLLTVCFDGAALAATCDPPGPPPRFGCSWSTTECTWFCAVCDPLGSPPRSTCHWDLDVCNWICPGYTGADVIVTTQQAPTTAATVEVRLSSLCTSTGAGASCQGSFAVSHGMTLAAKCEAIAGVVSAQCVSAGYTVSENDCATAFSFIASNTGCPGTPFALGVSNDPGTFDQSGAGPLPDGEQEEICGPAPGPVKNLRLAKQDGGLSLLWTWDDAADADGYVAFEDPDPGGLFASQVGSATSGTAGLTSDMPTGREFFLVAATNSECGVGGKK